MKELIIHAGLHKTGSTSIQYSLSANRDILKKYNYLYPEFKTINGRLITNHSIVLSSLFSEEPANYRVNVMNTWDAGQVNKLYENQFNEILRKSGDRNLIISAEGLSVLKERELDKLRSCFSDYKTRVLIYVRDPYFTTCSTLQAWIKKGTVANLDISPNLIQMGSRNIKKFKNVFPETEIYSFEKVCLEGGPVNHFLKMLGITDLNGFIEAKVNEGMSNKLTRLGLYINRFEPCFRNNKPNPVRKGFYLNELEFNNEKFYLTRQEISGLEDIINTEREALGSLLDFNFNTDIPCSDNLRLSPGETRVLMEKSYRLNLRLKCLIWKYIESNSDADKTEKKLLFSLPQRLVLRFIKDINP